MQSNTETAVTLFKDRSGPQLQQALDRLQKAVNSAKDELQNYLAHNMSKP